MTALSMLFCPDCSDEKAFESPGCGDGHGPDCVELCCVECGVAVVIGDLAGGTADDRQILAEAAAVRVGHAA